MAGTVDYSEGYPARLLPEDMLVILGMGFVRDGSLSPKAVGKMTDATAKDAALYFYEQNVALAKLETPPKILHHQMLLQNFDDPGNAFVQNVRSITQKQRHVATRDQDLLALFRHMAAYGVVADNTNRLFIQGDFHITNLRRYGGEFAAKVKRSLANMKNFRG